MAAHMTAVSRPGSEENTCHAKGCTTEIEPAQFMCQLHRDMIPAPMREAIKVLCGSDRQARQQHAAEYLAITEAAINAVAHKESRQSRSAGAAAGPGPAAPTAPATSSAPVPPEGSKSRRGRNNPRPTPAAIQLALF